MLFFYRKKLKITVLNNYFCKGLYFFDFEFYLSSVFNSFYFFLTVLKRKTQMQLGSLTDMFIFDNLCNANRFSLIYSLLSMKYNFRMSVLISVGDLVSVVSSISLYASACWAEREAWDMFGIFFSFNPNLSRILTDYGFKGHPLRKDFPLTGFFEIFYNDLIKSIVFSSVLLTQDYRAFSNNLHTIC